MWSSLSVQDRRVGEWPPVVLLSIVCLELISGCNHARGCCCGQLSPRCMVWDGWGGGGCLWRGVVSMGGDGWQLGRCLGFLGGDGRLGGKEVMEGLENGMWCGSLGGDGRLDVLGCG